MADDAVFSGPPGKGPNWLLIGGAGVAVVAVIVLITRSSGGSGTTAAGASINAGLGSLQEEQMNLLGTVQAGQMANNANFASIGGQIADTQKAILDALTAQGTTTGQQIQGAIDSVNQNTNAGNASILGSIADALQKVLTGQGAITETIHSESQTIQGQVGGVSSNIASNQQQIISALGSIQASEQGIITTIQPMLQDLLTNLANLTSLQQQATTATGSQLTSIQGQISSLQNSISSGQADILSTLGQMDTHNQINFNAVQAALNGQPNPLVLAGLLNSNSTGF